MANILEGNGIIPSSTVSSNHLAISKADRYFLALGCARGLAALHAHSETLIHRDVKSFNFLVDGQFNVKIADLELGTMSLLTNALSPTDPNAQDKSRSSILSHTSGNEDADDKPPNFSFESKYSVDLESTGSIAYLGVLVMTRVNCFDLYPHSLGLKKNEILPNWAAPEVLQSGVHVKASDVYSLALVLW